MFSDPPIPVHNKKSTLTSAVQLAVLNLPETQIKEVEPVTIDWNNAPIDADFYADGLFYKYENGVYLFLCENGNWLESSCQSRAVHSQQKDYQPNLKRLAEASEKETNMTSKVDWSKAPNGAEFYAKGHFWKLDPDTNGLRKFPTGETISQYLGWHISNIQGYSDYEVNPNHIVDTIKKAWTESESRIDAIGQNVQTGEHNETIGSKLPDETGKDYFYKSSSWVELTPPATASDFLSEGLRILEQRGQQYDPNGKKELSFDAVAEAFCCLTGKHLRGSDVCLMLALLKVVRQNSATQFHQDSAVDGINYMALWAELLKMERG